MIQLNSTQDRTTRYELIVAEVLKHDPKAFDRDLAQGPLPTIVQEAIDKANKDRSSYLEAQLKDIQFPSDSKTCKTCKLTKSYDNYYAHPKTKDLHDQNCKACKALIGRKSYLKVKIDTLPYVYKVTCSDGRYYIGHTISTPTERLRCHLGHNSTNSLSHYIAQNGLSINDLQITKIKSCETKTEAALLEKQLIKENTSDDKLLNIRLR